MLRSALLAILAIGVAVAAPVPKPREKSKDEQALEGTWLVLKYEGGIPSPGGKLEYLFRDGKWTVICDGKPNSWSESYKLRPSTTPIGIDIAEGDRLALGIYEIDGDQLRIAMPCLPKGDRPTTFEVNASVVVFTCKRVKAAKEK